MPKHPTYPVGLTCPGCGAAEYRRVKPHSDIAFAPDRVCTACGTRYTPPTPAWGRMLFVAVGLGAAIVGGGVGYWLMTGEPPRTNGGILTILGGLAACVSLIATAFRMK